MRREHDAQQHEQHPAALVERLARLPVNGLYGLPPLSVRLQDLAGNMTVPCAVMFLMGTRTPVPLDFTDESLAEVRPDLLDQMGRLDPTAPTLQVIYERIRETPKRIVFAEGEEANVPPVDEVRGRPTHILC